MSTASAEAIATAQSEFAEMKNFDEKKYRGELKLYKEKQSCMKDA